MPIHQTRQYSHGGLNRTPLMHSRDAPCWGTDSMGSISTTSGYHVYRNDQQALSVPLRVRKAAVSDTRKEILSLTVHREAEGVEPVREQTRSACPSAEVPGCELPFGLPTLLRLQEARSSTGVHDREDPDGPSSRCPTAGVPGDKVDPRCDAVSRCPGWVRPDDHQDVPQPPLDRLARLRRACRKDGWSRAYE
jgi:hypothetical protein